MLLHNYRGLTPPSVVYRALTSSTFGSALFSDINKSFYPFIFPFILPVFSSKTKVMV